MLLFSVTCGTVECKNGVTECNPENDKCKCPVGLENDDCGKITGCSDALIKTCADITSICIYDPQETNKATCKCPKNQKFDGKTCKGKYKPVLHI